MSDTKILNMTILARQVDHQYRLDQYTKKELLAMLGSYRQAQKEILKKFDTMTDFSKSRAITTLEELQDTMVGLKRGLGMKVSSIAGNVSEASAKAHSKILNFNGNAANVESVALSAADMAAFWRTTPVGGYLLDDWVGRIFSQQLKDKIQKEVGTGLLRAESYRDIAKRLRHGFEMTERELETLVKTYVHSANIDALKQVYNANSDIVKAVRWTAAISSATCIRCAGLDGETYKVNGAPPCPLHPRCRCVLIPLVDQGKMGLNTKQINDVARGYDIRPNTPIGYGGRKVIEAGQFRGSFGDWIKSQPEKVQRQYLGKGRHELLKQGKVGFSDFVDLKDGRLRTIKELDVMAGSWKAATISSFDDVMAKIEANIAKAENLPERIEAAKLKEQVAEILPVVNKKLREYKRACNQYKSDSKNFHIRSRHKDLGTYEDWSKAAMKKLDAMYDEASAMAKSYNSMKKLREKLLTGSKLLDPAEVLNIGEEIGTLKRSLKTPRTRAQSALSAMKDLAKVEKIISPKVLDNIPEVSIVGKKGGRAKYTSWEQRIHMTRPELRQAAHEYGHHIEYSNPEAKRAVNEFFKKRTKTGHEKHLGGNYDMDEFYMTDKWRDNYIGKIYPDGVTEVLSMGLEYMATDPVGFYKDDKEMFELILKIIKGYL